MANEKVPVDSIVVGVDGSPSADRALAWAARQAELEHRPLVLLHSADPVVLHEPGWVGSTVVDYASLAAALDHAAHQMLRRARAAVGTAAPDVDVVPVLVRPGAREALVEASERARLLVLGSHGRGPVGSALIGSVSASVARHAACPVVVCRPDGQDETRVGAPAVRRIVVGADGTAASVPVLEFAFAQAATHGATLSVMHCFWDVLVAAHRGVVTDSDPEAASLDDLRLLLSESVAGLGEKYPDVDVSLDLARGMVDECLADRSLHADLVVVGRVSPHGLERFTHVSCALAVLERAHTAVAVVPEA